MALYLDTSCILKLLWNEAETERTIEIIRAEDRSIVSDLGWLETKVRIQSRRAAGLLTRRGASALLAKAEALLVTPPFERRQIPRQVFDDAAAQVVVGDGRSHCRTLDRLHLAAVAGLGLDRVLTNDDGQARAARALGVTVLLPR